MDSKVPNSGSNPDTELNYELTAILKQIAFSDSSFEVDA